MKKMKLLGMMALTAIVLSGCQTASDREAALKDQVEQLEQQVTSLEQTQDSDTSNDTVSEDDSLQNTSTKNNNQDNFTDDTLDALSEAVNDVVKAADKLISSGSSSKDQNEFFTLQSEFHEVENRLDHYEDHIEYELRQGNLTHDEARNAEYELEKLEDKLDYAEEKLEHTFGYDD